MRGFVKSSYGAPDEQRAARIILKDLVNVRKKKIFFLIKINFKLDFDFNLI